jgi:hypothetical protein
MTAWTCAECASENDGSQCVVCGAAQPGRETPSGRARPDPARDETVPGRVRWEAADRPPDTVGASGQHRDDRVTVPVGRIYDTDPGGDRAPFDYTAAAAPRYDHPEPGPAVGTSTVVTSSAYRQRRMSWAWLAVAALVLVTVAGVVAARYAGLLGQPTARPANPTSNPPAPEPTATGQAQPDRTEAAPTNAAAPSLGIVRIAPDAAADAVAQSVARVLDTYFSAVNRHDAREALSVYDPAGVINPNDPAQVDSFARGISTTTDEDITLLSVGPDPSGAGSARAEVTFTSTQAPGYGPRPDTSETCTSWHVRYVLTRGADDAYRIMSSSATHRPC